jgi:hypothetical protein
VFAFRLLPRVHAPGDGRRPPDLEVRVDLGDLLEPLAARAAGLEGVGPCDVCGGVSDQLCGLFRWCLQSLMEVVDVCMREMECWRASCSGGDGTQGMPFFKMGIPI